MNLGNIAIEYRELARQLDREGKEAKFVRLTCEQLANLKDHPASAAWLTLHESGLKFDGLPIVTRGSIADCNMREARPRVVYIDLTKVE